MSKCIDAEVLKNNMHKIVWTQDMKSVEKFVDSLPAADVQEVKHGRWERKYRANFICSVCNYWVKTTDEYGNTIDGDMNDYKYCPNCGSRMDLGEETK